MQIMYVFFSNFLTKNLLAKFNNCDVTIKLESWWVTLNGKTLKGITKDEACQGCNAIFAYGCDKKSFINNRETL